MAWISLSLSLVKEKTICGYEWIAEENKWRDTHTADPGWFSNDNSGETDGLTPPIRWIYRSNDEIY